MSAGSNLFRHTGANIRFWRKADVRMAFRLMLALG